METVSPWKRLEKTTAVAMGGKRVLRGADFSRSAPDVEMEGFSVECKYRKNLPKLLLEGLAQAQKYAPEKIPLLVVKQRYQRGALVVLRLDDFLVCSNREHGGQRNTSAVGAPMQNDCDDPNSSRCGKL